MGNLSSPCTMEVFLSLFLLSVLTAQETFCACPNNMTGIGMESGTGLPPSDCTSKGKQIISLLNAYRAENGLLPIQKSCALCTVANEKAVSGNGHSWTGRFACTYDANNFDCMWKKPSQLTGYKGNGYENWSSATTADAAFNGWKSSSSHNDVMINKGSWTDITWSAVGAAVTNQGATLWFGAEEDESVC